MTINDDVKFFLGLILFFVVATILIGTMNSKSEMAKCEGFQKAYGEVITCDKQFFWTRGYLELPDGKQIEIFFTLDDHILIQSIY